MDCRTGYSRLSRRTMFTGLAGLGLSVLAKGPLLAQAQSGLRVRPHRVDVHHHLFPPSYRSAIAEANGGALAAWTVEQSLAEMDKGSIQTAILSLSPPGLWFGDAVQARNLARIVNDYGTKVRQDFPGRFGLFAALPLPDIEGSLREIEYWLDTLKADGIGLMTNYGDKWLGDASFAPVWEELNRRKAVAYVHPLVASCCGRLSVGAFPAVIEVPHDTTRTVVSLLLSGSFARERDIKWLFAHGGGTIPFLAGRIEAFYEQRARAASGFAPDGIEAEFRRLYYDTANATHPAAMAALMKLAPVSQITYGTDYPYFPLNQIDNLRQLNLPAGDLTAIASGNATRLLPRLSA